MLFNLRLVSMWSLILYMYFPQEGHLFCPVLFEDEDEVVFLIKKGDSIDFDTALAENIVEQVPLRVLSAEEKSGKPMPNGKGWSVISEDDYKAQQQKDDKVDPRLAKLQNLFPDQDNKK